MRRRFREASDVPLAALMFAVLFVAVGLAALRDPSELWASSLFSLTLVLLLVAMLGTVAHRGATRVAFLGFTLFAGTYLLLAFSPWPWINDDGLRPPQLVTGLLINRASESRNAATEHWKAVYMR